MGYVSDLNQEVNALKNQVFASSRAWPWSPWFFPGSLFPFVCSADSRCIPGGGGRQVRELEADGKILGGLDQVQKRHYGAELGELERDLGTFAALGPCVVATSRFAPGAHTYTLYFPLRTATANKKLAEAEVERASIEEALKAAQEEAQDAQARADGMLDEINELLVINRELNDDLDKAGGESRSLVSTPARTAAAARAGLGPAQSSTLLPKNIVAKIEASLVADLEEQLQRSRDENSRLQSQLEAAGLTRAQPVKPLQPNASANGGGEGAHADGDDAKRKASAAMDFFAGLTRGGAGKDDGSARELENGGGLAE